MRKLIYSFKINMFKYSVTYKIIISRLFDLVIFNTTYVLHVSSQLS